MKPVVLLVDDEPALLDAIRVSLRHEPFEILTATSGETALEILASTAIDVVVSDEQIVGRDLDVGLRDSLDAPVYRGTVAKLCRRARAHAGVTGTAPASASPSGGKPISTATCLTSCAKVRCCLRWRPASRCRHSSGRSSMTGGYCSTAA